MKDKNKESIKKPPEETENRPKGTLINKTVIRLPNGEEHLIKDTIYQQNKATGHWDRITMEIPITDASGRLISADMIVGTSWTDRLIPVDHFAACKNPWEDHDYRLVYLKIDGFATKLGNVLCTECYEKNKKKLRLRKWLACFYAPEVF